MKLQWCYIIIFLKVESERAGIIASCHDCTLCILLAHNIEHVRAESLGGQVDVYTPGQRVQESHAYIHIIILIHNDMPENVFSVSYTNV